MFSNRKKRIETNKNLYYSNKINYHLSPHNGVIPELVEEENLWTSKGTNDIYNTNTGNVAICMNTNPLCSLDVSGSVNTSTKYTINYISIAPPVGSIMAYTMAISPDGWLICDGTAVSRLIYNGLFTIISTTFGVGDASSTFNLPNYQGAFLRGTGTSPNGTYVGPSLNASQTHATQTHNHTASSVVTDNGHSHSQNTVNDDFNNNQVPPGYPSGSNPSFANYDSAGSRTWTNISSSTTGVTVATTVNNSTTSVNANETRPYNYGVYWIIKY